MNRFRLSLLIAAGALAPMAAHAQDAGWNVPYGMNNSANTGWNNPHRDANGNLQVVNGIIQSGAGSHSTLAQQGKGGVGVASASAFGNQLNVVTSGKFNTVIVNSTQINNGDVVAVAGTNSGKDQTNDDQ